MTHTDVPTLTQVSDDPDVLQQILEESQELREEVVPNMPPVFWPVPNAFYSAITDRITLREEDQAAIREHPEAYLLVGLTILVVGRRQSKPLDQETPTEDIQSLPHLQPRPGFDLN